jgi:hypothetical protein
LSRPLEEREDKKNHVCVIKLKNRVVCSRKNKNKNLFVQEKTKIKIFVQAT